MFAAIDLDQLAETVPAFPGLMQFTNSLLPASPQPGGSRPLSERLARHRGPVHFQKPLCGQRWTELETRAGTQVHPSSGEVAAEADHAAGVAHLSTKPPILACQIITLDPRFGAMSQNRRFVHRGLGLAAAVTVVILVADEPAVLAAGKTTWQAKERTARKSCLSGDWAKGIDILADLFVDTRDPTYIFNQGRCLEQNHRYEDAIEKFKEFLRTGETQNLRTEDKESAEKHIAACKETLAAQGVVAEPVGPLAPPPITPAVVPPLAPAPVEPAPIVVQTDAVKPSPNAGSGLRIAGIVTAAFGLAAAGAGIGFNVLANNTVGDMESTLNGYASKKSDRDTYVTLSWVGYGVGAACLVTGAVLYGIGLRARSKASTQVALVPAVGPGQAGLVFTGAF